MLRSFYSSIPALVRLCNHLFKRNGSIYIDVFGYEVEVQVCQNAVTAEFSRFVFDCYSIFFDNTSKIMRNSSNSQVMRCWEDSGKNTTRP